MAAESATPGVGRLDGAAHLRLHLRPDDERDRRPARPAARWSKTARTRAAPPTRSAWMPPIASAPASAPATGLTPCACSPTGDVDARQPHPARPHPAAARGGRRRARARRPHRGRGRPAEAGRARPRSRAIAEIVDDDGEMMRLPGLIALGEREDVPVITIEALIALHGGAAAARPTRPPSIDVPESSRVTFEVETNVPTEHGAFRVRAYRDRSTGADHVAWISGDPTERHAGARALGVPDRRGVRLAEVRVRPAAAGGARHDRRARAASSSTCAATRAAASA